MVSKHPRFTLSPTIDFCNYYNLGELSLRPFNLICYYASHPWVELILYPSQNLRVESKDEWKATLLLPIGCDQLWWTRNHLVFENKNNNSIQSRYSINIRYIFNMSKHGVWFCGRSFVDYVL